MRRLVVSVLPFLALVACGGSSGSATATAPAAAPPASSAPASVPAASGSPAGTAASTPVASWEGGALTYGDIAGSVKGSLTKLEAEYLTNRYETESQALEQALNDKLLEAEAKKRGMASPIELLKAEVETKAGQPTDQEVQELYEANARRLGGQPLEAVRDQVEGAVRQRKQQERYMAYMEELRTAYKVSLTLPYPELPRFEVSVDDDPSMGPADAPVTIVQFAEFQCPYCGKARESLAQVEKAYPGKVRFVFRDFPLGFHDRAIPAAVAANCAGKQDPAKYWKVHDILMTNQRALQEPDLERAAQEAGVDMAKWKSCRTEVAMEEEVKKDMADGEAVGVSGTPAFFVNGIFLNGAVPFERFKSIIDRELAKKG
jgi:protein-disulfide isomerase